MSTVAPPSALSEADYLAIEAAVMETDRGRWFLSEFARRNRAADTQSVLAAVRQLEATVRKPVPSVGAMPNPQTIGPAHLTEFRARLAEMRRIILRATHEARRGIENRDISPWSKAVADADGAVAGIRRMAGKIQEVSFEVREAGRMGVYAEALDVYARDIIAACESQAAATDRLSKLAKTLGAIERRVANLIARVGGSGASELDDDPDTKPPAKAEADVGWSEGLAPATMAGETSAELSRDTRPEPVAGPA